MNDVSDTNTIFDDFSINDSENSKSCEGSPFTNMQGNEAGMCDSHFQGKFVSKNFVNLSKQNVSEKKFLFCQRVLILSRLVIR